MEATVPDILPVAQLMERIRPGSGGLTAPVDPLGPSRSVGSGPGWSTGRLVRHLG